jgi:16S rRNA (guanine(966)-N(2))-methyltransferase RsmD
VRIIGGQWKRSKLPVPDAPGLRPTPDRVRETLFNWLGQHLEGWRVLDAFAGTGALGFEAASRGAARVLMLEQNPALQRSLRASQAKLSATQVDVRGADALNLMARMAPLEQFELILLDPPFAQNLFEPAVRAAVPLLVEGGWLYLEADRAFDAATLEAWGVVLHRHLRAGTVHAHLLQRAA